MSSSLNERLKKTIDLYGSNAFCIPTAEALLAKGYVVRCVTTRLPAKHKSRTEISSPLAEFAASHTLLLKEVRTKKDLEEMYRQWMAPDAIVVASFGILIPPSLLTLPKHGVLNIHPSLLPKYRGPSPIQTAILSGDDTTGVTIILLDDQMDHGPILLQEPTNILPTDTTSSLKERLAKQGADLLMKAIEQLGHGTITAVAQNDVEATFTKKIAKEDGRIQWSDAAKSIDRKSRAYDLWPGLWTTWNKRIVKLFDCSIVSSNSIEKPGTVLGMNDGVLRIQCAANTAIGVRQIQIEGKKRMDVQSFIQGSSTVLKAIFE